jgi:hypothetical protein
LVCSPSNLCLLSILDYNRTHHSWSWSGASLSHGFATDFQGLLGEFIHSLSLYRLSTFSALGTVPKM